MDRREAGAALARWEDKRALRNLMGIYANYLILNRDGEICQDLWSSREDVAYGTGDGWYVGAASVRGYYAAREAKNRRIAELLIQALPHKFAGKTADDVYGIGVFRSMPVSCPIIEIAGDGRTAKGLWYSPGFEGARWSYGICGADFVREADGWKIWHLIFGTDFTLAPGALRSEQPIPASADEEIVYTARYNFAAYPGVPAPYETWTPETGYGPEGNPRYRKMNRGGEAK